MDESVNPEMPAITHQILQRATTTESQLHLHDKAAMMDKIQRDNPVLFDSIAIQRDLGHDPEYIQVLFDMLLKIQLAFDLNNKSLPVISQQSYLSELHKFSQQLSFGSGLSAEQHRQTIQQLHDTHKEPELLLWAQRTMTQAGFADMGTIESKQLTLAGITMVNCVANAE